MTKNAASEAVLGDLHNKVAKVMTTALNQIDTAQDVFNDLVERAKDNGDDELLVEALDKKVEVNASLLSVITKFLNDNKISCAPEESQELSGLAQVLANKKKRRSVGSLALVHSDD